MFAFAYEPPTVYKETLTFISCRYRSLFGFYRINPLLIKTLKLVGVQERVANFARASRRGASVQPLD